MMFHEDEEAQRLVTVPIPRLASYPKGWIDWESPEVLHEKREYPRLRFKVPVLMRDAAGVQDAAIIEEVSKGRFPFSSGQLFIVGEAVSASVRCGFGTEAFQTQDRIVHKSQDRTGDRTLYGASYLRSDGAGGILKPERG